MIVAGPLEELELADKHRLQPLAFRHLRLGQALTPSAASRLREVGEWAFADLESLEPPEQLGTCRRREPAGATCRIEQNLSWTGSMRSAMNAVTARGV